MSDVHIHGSGLAIEIVSPYQVKQLFSAKHLAPMLGQRVQQVELLSTQPYGLVRQCNLAAGRVYGQLP